MSLLNKELIRKGMELEAARRSAPFDEKGHSKNWEQSNKIYQEFLLRHGILILEELSKHIKE